MTLKWLLSPGAVLVGLALWSPLALAAEKNLPLPRFASLRSFETNLRTGPGVRYPIEWVFMRRDMPVEIVEEHETWRLIQDQEGTRGWVHQSLLSGKRAFVVTAERASLRRHPREDANTVAVAERGVMGHVAECQQTWCKVEAQGMKGWVERATIWGVYEEETVK